LVGYVYVVYVCVVRLRLRLRWLRVCWLLFTLVYVCVWLPRLRLRWLRLVGYTFAFTLLRLRCGCGYGYGWLRLRCCWVTLVTFTFVVYVDVIRLVTFTLLRLRLRLGYVCCWFAGYGLRYVVVGCDFTFTLPLVAVVGWLPTFCCLRLVVTLHVCGLRTLVLYVYVLLVTFGYVVVVVVYVYGYVVYVWLRLRLRWLLRLVTFYVYVWLRLVDYGCCCCYGLVGLFTVGCCYRLHLFGWVIYTVGCLVTLVGCVVYVVTVTLVAHRYVCVLVVGYVTHIRLFTFTFTLVCCVALVCWLHVLFTLRLLLRTFTFGSHVWFTFYAVALVIWLPHVTHARYGLRWLFAFGCYGCYGYVVFTLVRYGCVVGYTLRFVTLVGCCLHFTFGLRLRLRCCCCYGLVYVGYIWFTLRLRYGCYVYVTTFVYVWLLHVYSCTRCLRCTLFLQFTLRLRLLVIWFTTLHLRCTVTRYTFYGYGWLRFVLRSFGCWLVGLRLLRFAFGWVGLRLVYVLRLLVGCVGCYVWLLVYVTVGWLLRLVGWLRSVGWLVTFTRLRCLVTHTFGWLLFTRCCWLHVGWLVWFVYARCGYVWLVTLRLVYGCCYVVAVGWVAFVVTLLI